MRANSLILLAAVLVAFTAIAEPPTVAFTSGGVTIGGVAPGTKVAWLGMTRERIDSHTRVRFQSGIAPVNASGKFNIVETGADRAHAVWVVADVVSGSGRRSAAPNFSPSPVEIVIRATSGQPSISVESASVALLYVRPNGGAWSFSTGDGSTLDGDGEANGIVVVPLSELKQLQGNPHPPATTEEGDVILVIDPSSIRTAQAAVTR